MTPTWQSDDGRVQLYEGDCLDVLPTLGKVDAVVTDPPYGISHPCNFSSRGRAVLAKCNDWPDVINDDRPFDPSLFLLFERVVMWGGNHFADKLPATNGWLVWDKERPDDLDQSTCELAWTNCIRGVRRFRHLWHGMMRASEHGENYHPTQKPVALMEWVLKLRWLSDAETILDPFMGSGTTCLACIRTGRRFIGIEKDSRYFRVAVDRIERELSQPMLFPPTQAEPVQEGLL